MKNSNIKRKDYQSEDEYLFACYLNELQDAGLVEEWDYEKIEFRLTKKKLPLRIPWYKLVPYKDGSFGKKLRWRPMINTKHGAEYVYYTPDFRVVWAPSADGHFFLREGGEYESMPFFYAEDTLGGFESIIEIKGGYDKHGSEAYSRSKIVQVYEEYHRIVQVVKVQKLFESTFSPFEYQFTESKKSFRKMRTGGKLVPIKDLPWHRTLEELMQVKFA